MYYSSLISSISQAHHRTVTSASRALNQHHIMRNWLIGAYLVEFEQKGKDRATYGSGLLKKVAADLAAKKIPGCAVRMLERMRVFYAQYPQLAEVISSSAMTISPLLQLTGAKRKSSSAMTKSLRKAGHAPDPLPAGRMLDLSWTHFIELIRLGNVWQRAFYENECLRGNWPIRHLQRQIGTQLDLKARAFQHGDAGQMNFYLNFWKENKMIDGDQPPVGLILCADKDEARVQYATGGLPHELMVSRYLTALPSPETIKALIERDQAMREQAQFQLPATR